MRDIIIATLDYLIDGFNKSGKKFESVNPADHFQELKKQTEELYRKGKTTKLRNWLRDLTEIPRETIDFNYVAYIKWTTGHDYNIFTAFYKRIDKIIAKGKISTENQFREVNSMVDFLCQFEPVDHKKIEVLNNLLLDFEHRLSGRKGKQKRFKKLDNYYSKDVLALSSPDKTKSVLVFENGDTKENAITQIMVSFGQGGGGIFAAKGTDPNLNIKWIDNSTICIILPKGLTVLKQEVRTQFLKDIVSVEYYEQT